MSYCPKCGAQMNDGMMFCPQCGFSMGTAGNAGEQPQPGTPVYGQQPAGGFNQQPVYGPDPYQVLERPILNRGQTAIVGYLGWLGFLIAMIAGDRKEKYARFHLNRALMMNLIYTGAGILLFIASAVTVNGAFETAYNYMRGAGVSPAFVIGTILNIVSVVAVIYTFVCWIIALVRACKGNAKPVPLIDKFVILK